MNFKKNTFNKKQFEQSVEITIKKLKKFRYENLTDELKCTDYFECLFYIEKRKIIDTVIFRFIDNGAIKYDKSYNYEFQSD